MNVKYIFILLTASIQILGMHDATTVPLAGKGIFSPSGKLLVVCGPKELSIYDTRSGKKLSDLENSASATCNPTDSFIFSPQETYVALKNRMWKLTDHKEHLPGVLKNETVKAWNRQETIFLTKALGIIPSIWYVCDASTADRTCTISDSAEPFHFSISDDGNLFAFSYPIIQPYYASESDPRSKTLIRNIKSHRAPLDVKRSVQTAFFSDNTHALVAYDISWIVLVNAKMGHIIQEFACGIDICSKLPTHCQISIDRLQSTITHSSTPGSFCTVNFNGTAFQFEKHEKSPVDPKLISNTKQFRINRVEKGARLYLYKPADLDYKPRLLLDSVNSKEEDAIFSGNHDEHILVLSQPKKVLHILRSADHHYYRQLLYAAFALSSDKHSFVITTPERIHILCILPRTVDIISKDKSTYFSLLPEDIIRCLKDYNA